MRPVVFVILLALAAFAVRLGFTAAYRGGLGTVPEHKIAGADGVEYDLFARNVVLGHGYAWGPGQPTSFRAPGLPFALVVVYSVFGISYPAAYIFFAAAGAVGAVGAYYLGRELLGDRRGRWVGVLIALYPPDIYAASYFFSELTYVPCLGFGLGLLVRHARTGSWQAALGAGALLGYAALSRSFGVLFLPLFGLYLLGNPLKRAGWRGAVLYGVGFLAVVLPWTARNYKVHGEFVLVATNGGSTYYGANNPVVAGSLKEHGNWVATTRLPGRDVIEAQPNEVAHDKMEYKLGTEWIKANPVAFVKLAVFKVVRFWLPFVHWTSLKVYPIPNIVLTAPFLVLILVGLLATLRTAEDRRRFAVLHLVMLATFVMVVIFWGEPRFRDANGPVLMVYALEGATRLWRRKSVATDAPPLPA